MGQGLFCQNEIREVLTLQELFGFGKKNRGRVCRSCEEKLPRLAGQTVCPGCMRPQASSVDLCEDCRRWRVPPPIPSWGQMINVGMNFMYFYWHLAVFPTAALAITVLATTLFGDGLRDALDPTLKGR